MKLLNPTRETGRLAAPPVSIACLACHGQFFAASLPIHQKSCFQRNAFMLVPCENCKTCVRACDFHTHTTSCPGKPSSPDSNVSMASHCAAKPQSNVNTRPPMQLNLPEGDGRVRCKICERAFSQDRISKHQSVCHGVPLSMKKKIEPKQRYVIQVGLDHVNSTIKQPACRKSVHIQRPLASRHQEMTFDLNRERNNQGEWSNGGFRVASGSRSLHVVPDSSRRRSSNYPGAQTMQAGGCDTSNASSASNPLVTNPLMSTRR